MLHSGFAPPSTPEVTTPLMCPARAAFCRERLVQIQTSAPYSPCEFFVRLFVFLHKRRSIAHKLFRTCFLTVCILGNLPALMCRVLLLVFLKQPHMNIPRFVEWFFVAGDCDRFQHLARYEQCCSAGPVFASLT